MDDRTLAEEVAAVVSAATSQPVTLASATRLAGGGSMETWALDLRVGDALERLVLRRDMAVNMTDTALTRAQEFDLIARAHAAGVRAPLPRWRSADGPRAWFLMDRVAGEGVGRRVVRLPELAAARATLAREMGRQLAMIHALPTDGALSFLPRPREGEHPCEVALGVLRRTVDALRRDRAAWEYGLRWLARRVPPTEGPWAALHGDLRVGNLLVAPEGLTAVIDWEFAHVGDVHEDLAWPTLRDWRFEVDALEVGGVGSLDDLLAGYADAGGRAVDRDALRWWQVAGNLKWAVFCHAQAQRHLDGHDRSVELASLGRKAAEVEWEMLDLIARTERERAT